MHLPYAEAAISDFTISYLLVSQNGIPATAFDADAAIYVSWESSGTYFNLYAGDDKQSQPLYSGGDKYFLVSQGFSVDTTLILEATYNDNKLYKSVTVTINNPALKPGRITIADNNTVKKDMTTNGDATINQLSVNGKLVLSDSNDPSFLINGPLRSGCQINVTGETTVPGLSAGNTTSKEVEILSKLTINKGTVSLFNESNIIYQGQDNLTNKQFTAHTDGYFIAYLTTYDVPSQYSFKTSITIQMNSYTFKTTGGSAWAAPANSGVICLPLSKGTSLTYSATYNSPFFVKAPQAITVQWYPIGQNSSSKATYELIDLPTDHMEAASIDMAARAASGKTKKLTAAKAFIQTIEQACGKTIDATTKELLAEKLMTFR
ncbi:hypothetical protein ACTJJB_30020 [Chitinophaga sp. 22536]|uniref:hypothetical protein n=1 Tax=unclassified Chitinophaga TaxID=2619133 RepID=UPI003F862C50